MSRSHDQCQGHTSSTKHAVIHVRWYFMITDCVSAVTKSYTETPLNKWLQTDSIYLSINLLSEWWVIQTVCQSCQCRPVVQCQRCQHNASQWTQLLSMSTQLNIHNKQTAARFTDRQIQSMSSRYRRYTMQPHHPAPRQIPWLALETS